MRNLTRTTFALALSFAVAACAMDEASDEAQETTPIKAVHHADHAQKKAAAMQEKLGLSDQQTASVEAAIRDNETWDARIAAIKKVLTTDQVAKLETMMAAHHKDGHDAHKKDPAAHAKKLQEVLGLTDEQTVQTEAAFRDSDDMKATHAALEKILTADQLAELGKLHADHKKGHHGKYKKGHHGKYKKGHHGKYKKGHHGKYTKDHAAHAKKLQEKLGLTDAQTTQVEAVFRKTDLSWDERKAQLGSILTADQAAELKALKKERHQKKGYGKHHWKGHGANGHDAKK